MILPVPFGPFGNSLLWQAQAQGYFRLASGWFGYWPAGYSTSLVISQLSGFQPFTDPVSLMGSFLATHRVGAVVMVAGQGGPWPQVMSQLGLKRIIVGGVWLYCVPQIWREHVAAHLPSQQRDPWPVGLRIRRGSRQATAQTVTACEGETCMPQGIVLRSARLRISTVWPPERGATGAPPKAGAKRRAKISTSGPAAA